MIVELNRWRRVRKERSGKEVVGSVQKKKLAGVYERWWFVFKVNIDGFENVVDKAAML